MIVLVLPTAATGDLDAAMQQADVGVPLAAVVLGQPESVRLITRTEPAPPTSTRRQPLRPWPAPPGTAPGAPNRAARCQLPRRPGRGRPPPGPPFSPRDVRRRLDAAGQTAELLRCYGIPLVEPSRCAVKTRRSARSRVACR